MSCCPSPYTCFSLPPTPETISLQPDIYWSNVVQLFSVAYWRKKIKQYVNIFVTDTIWAFMRICITTCVIKQSESEFLKLYKCCALLPADVTTNQRKKNRLFQVHSALCSFAAWSVECWPIKMKLQSLLFDDMWNWWGLKWHRIKHFSTFIPFSSASQHSTTAPH
jgi:hypothetical protein